MGLITEKITSKSAAIANSITNYCGAVSGGAFDPLSQSGMQFWYKSDGVWWQDSGRTTLATAQNDPIGAMDDYSGNARHALQAVAGSRPLVNLAQQNGYRAALTDGVDDTLAPAAGITLGSNGTLICVYNTAQVTGQRAPFSDNPSSKYYWHSSATNFYGFFDTGFHRNSTQAALSGIQIVVWTVDSAGTTGKIYRNGSQVGGDVVIGNVSWTVLSFFSGTAGFVVGNFLEAYGYNVTLDATALANHFNGYLNPKYLVY